MFVGLLVCVSVGWRLVFVCLFVCVCVCLCARLLVRVFVCLDLTAALSPRAGVALAKLELKARHRPLGVPIRSTPLEYRNGVPL